MPIKFLILTASCLFIYEAYAKETDYIPITKARPLTQMEKLFVTTKYRLVYRKRDLDPVLWDYLQEDGVEEIADRGEAFYLGEGL